MNKQINELENNKVRPTEPEQIMFVKGIIADVEKSSDNLRRMIAELKDELGINDADR